MDERDKEALSELQPGTEPKPASKRNTILAVAGFFFLGLALALLLFGGPLLNNLAGEQAVVLPQIPTTVGKPDLRDNYVNPLVAGDKAYDFTLRDLDGQDVALSDFAGQPVIVNFWATWCAPCRIEMPELQNAFDTYQDQELVVLAVNAQEDEQQVRAFFDELDFTIKPLLDSDGQVGRAYGAPGLPTTFFVDGSGEVTAVHRGILTGDQIEQYVAQMLP